MEWPKITDNFTARNGYTIEPISSTEDALAHGREIRNGLEVAGIYHRIAASGGNVIFAVRDPAGNVVGSGSLKSGNEGIAFVNFLRGARNVEFPRGSSAYAASEEWAQAINDRSITLNAIPTAAGLFVKAEPDAPAPRQEAQEREPNIVNRTMTAFMNLVLHARLHAPTPIAPQADADAVPSIEFTPREVPEGTWSGIASPGAPNPETGLSVIPATDATMLRYIVEQCECRMMWEFDRARQAVEEGVVQIAGIMSNDPNSPVVGYAMLAVRDGRVVPTQITGRFDHRPTPAMIDTVTNWVSSVNALTPGETGPTGVTRNIGIDGARFMVENYERGTEPHYNEFGQLIEAGRGRDYNPGLAISDIRTGSIGAILPPDLEDVVIRSTDMPTLTNIETIIPGLRFRNISAAAYPDEIDIQEVLAGRAVPFHASAPIFGIIEGQPVQEPDRQAEIRREEDQIVGHLASADGLNETDLDGNGIPDNDERGLGGLAEDGDDLFSEPPSVMGLLRRTAIGEIAVSVIPRDDAINDGMIRSLKTVIENVAAMSQTLENEMKMATKPLVTVAEKFYPELVAPAPAQPQAPGIEPEAPAPRPAGPAPGL